MSVSKEWLKKYDEVKDLLKPSFDLDIAFRNKEFNNTKLDVLDIGEVNLKSGKILTCDPLAYLNDDQIDFYIQEVKPSKYKVSLLVIEDEERYAMMKVTFSNKEPKRYELAVTGEEDLSNIEEGEFFGYPVDAGMGCVCDFEAAKKYLDYEKKLEKDNEEFDNRYDDLFSELLESNAAKHPKYQSSYGDWLNWTIPNTDLNIVLFSSGYGDGYYPSYFGYDENNEVCALYTVFIDLYDDDNE